MWHTAIGLQAVDGLTPSKYLVETAIQNIEGEITLDQVQKRLESYYEENPEAGSGFTYFILNDYKQTPLDRARNGNNVEAIRLL